MNHSLIAACLALSILPAGSTAATHQTKSTTGVVFTFSESGVNAIKLPGGRDFAQGTSVFRSGHADFFKAPLPHALPGKLIEQSIDPPGGDGDTVVRVTHTFEHAAVRYVFEVSGNDLHSRATVEHLGKSGLPLRTPCFEGLVFHFEREATGFMPSWHVSYLREHGVPLMHPSQAVPIGAAWAADDAAGFSLFTPRHLDRQKVFHAHWAKDHVIPAKCAPQFFVHDDIEPACTKVYEWSVRVGENTDWKWLLEPYRAAFLKHMPPIQYTIDDRPLAQFASANKAHVTRSNPHGFNGVERRFDHPKGVERFVAMVAPALKAAGGQGCMFWAVQGVNPRGAMYRPDFDVFPPEIEANLPKLAAGFKQHGLRIGLCTRPGEGCDRSDWRTDGTFRLSPENSSQMARLMHRFTKAREMGFSMFYLDTFGSQYDDYRIMVQLRKHLGPDVPTWSEYSTDLMLPFTGRYTEWTRDGPAWITPERLEVLRWLMPTSLICVNRSAQSYDEMGARRLTPIVEDYLVPKESKGLAAFSAKYLESNRFKK